MPKFEVFQKRMSRPSEVPYVSIQRGGSFSINKAAHIAMGEPEAIELLYDPEERVIGIRGIGREIPHAYPLRTSSAKRDSPYLASGRAFTQYYSIDTATARRYKAYTEEGILCVDLKEPGVEMIGNRNRNGYSKPVDTEPPDAVEQVLP